MSSTPSFQLVKHKVGKTNFEILTKPGAALKFKDGKLGFDNVLVTDVIFKNQAKGDKANSAELISAFGTDNEAEVAKQILDKGELQLSQAERTDKVVKKRAEIVNYLHKYYIDPRTNTPHPVTRIELALDELKIRIDPDQPAERQAQDALKKLPDVIPIKKSEIEGEVILPHKFLAQCTGVIGKWATVRSQSYNTDGCTMQVSLVPGDYDAFTADLQRITKGEFQFNIQGQAAKMASGQEDEGSSKKGKGKAGAGGGGAGAAGGGKGKGKGKQ
mmetsp:Transcript_23611/g.40611  ORF Transcript_23611/g.40611 Transcript_23611/m.40611 type:complete len:273 (-) Transcript_23611:511-1329(-)|eukprot:CAMPEP_0196660980 /NCGR_PEP_ID=MMETSP1086-20130531/42042_1 /TAXON_ID=77921 /ORGANISM="Cyanoptyche  gloeocystis , Strain SAG4.97" /LENGTH=272 /DNA_ID=CAMNT_0041995657 /DNA_START=31 /DNA_END=849 /DNA_ORIENTATION=+